MADVQKESKKLRSQYIPTSEFYSQIIDSLQDYSILTLDNELKINSWSSGSVSIFGYESEDVLGESFEIIFTEEDKKNGIPQQEIDKALKEGRAVDNRWHVCKDESTFYAYGLVFPLIGIDGEMLGYVKILLDLTERKKAEDAIKNYVKELEELNTHKESVLAILSHDLRSPLSSIIGTAKYLKDNFDKMKPEAIILLAVRCFFVVYLSFILWVKIYRPFYTIFVSKHSKIRTPRAVCNWHFNISAC